MRVVSGTCRGRKLSAPVGLTTRPTSDRVKEALFNILSSRINFGGARILDICAGTGGLGIEALSRGASFCSFVESAATVKVVLQKNIMATGFQAVSEILAEDAIKALQKLGHRGQCYDIAFFDPPYASDLYQAVPEWLVSSKLLTAGAILIVECSRQNQLPESFGLLRRFDRRVYGDTAIELFIMEEK